MSWILGALIVFLLVRPNISRAIPPHVWYLSARKRRAMRLALAEYGRDKSARRPDWAGSRVYRSDREKCFVFIRHDCQMISPPSYEGYVIWNNRDRIDHLGSWQFHWGIRPRHAVEWYESVIAVGEWPAGQVNAICGLLCDDPPSVP